MAHRRPRTPHLHRWETPRTLALSCLRMGGELVRPAHEMGREERAGIRLGSAGQVVRGGRVENAP